MKPAVLIVVCLIAFSCCRLAVGQQVSAQLYYVLGDKAYRQGDLAGAIDDWTNALRLKPASELTKKRLIQARAQLYSKFKNYTARNDIWGDPVSAYVTINEAIKLLPEKVDLVVERELIRSKLTNAQSKALDAYYKAVAYVYLKDFENAYTAILEAKANAGDSVCIQEAVRLIEQVRPKVPPVSIADSQVPEGKGDEHKAENSRLKMYVFSSSWCTVCKSMSKTLDALRNAYGDRVDIVDVDIDQQPDLAGKYTITTVPAQVIVKPDGNVAFKHIGSMSLDALTIQLQQLGLS